MHKLFENICISAACIMLLIGCYGCGQTTVEMPHNPFDGNELIIGNDYTVDEALKRINVYSSARLTDFLPQKYVENPEYEDIRKAIQDNSDIDDTFKSYLEDFVSKLEASNYNIDLRPFYMNISMLKVVYVGESEMTSIIQQPNGQGVFMPDIHTVYLNKDGNKDIVYAVIPHEIGHMLNNLYFEYKGYTVIRDFCKAVNYGFILEEGLDSLFVDTLFEIDPKELPYRIPNNYSQVLINGTDYSFEKYVNGSVIDYQSVLDNSVKDILPEYDFDDLLFDIANANNDYKHDAYNSETYKSLDLIFSTVYFDSIINENSTSNEIREAYDDYISTVSAQDPEGVILNKDMVNKALEEALTRKNISLDVH